MSHGSQEQVERYRRWAERVRAEAQSASVRRELAELQRELVGRAYELENACRAPITIGVVGEYSTGKSLLLGTLLGRPELLPVSSEATTGNVTAVRLTAGPPGSPVAITGASVNLLSGSQVAACAAFILAKICTTTAETGLPIDVSALDRYNPVRDGWQTFEQWCRRYVWPDQVDVAVHEASVLGVRDSAWELLRIRNALDRGGDLIDPVNPGASRPLSVDDCVAALTIGGARKLPASFPMRPATVPLPVHTELTAELLRELFPLVGRVNLHVSVPPDGWPVTELDGVREVEFLDFPGLNARGAARDDFLSASLLQPVHTILVVVRAERPATEVPTKFLALLAGHGRSRDELADAVLVVGNMVDLLQPPAVGGGPATVAQVCRDPALRALVDTGNDLTGRHPERLAATSTLYAIDVQQMPVRPGQELAAALVEHRPTVERRMHGWRLVADALHAGDPFAPLTGAIIAASEDGGIGALRAMISRHVTDHGVRLKLEALRRHHDTMHRLVTELEWRDQTTDRTVGDGTVAALFALRDDLLRAEQVLSDGVAKLLLGTADADWRQLLDEAFDELRTKVAGLVYLWAGWDETLDAARATGHVVVPRRPSQAGAADPFAGPGSAPKPAPPVDRRGRRHTPHNDNREHAPGEGGEIVLDTAEMRSPFARFVQDAIKAAGPLFHRLMERWMREQSDRLAEVWEGASDPFAEPDRVRALAAFDVDGGVNRRGWLMSLVQLEWLDGYVQKRLKEAFTDPQRLDGEALLDAFPLLPMQRLPWAPGPAVPAGEVLAPDPAVYAGAVDQPAHRPEGHVVRILRMRQEVTDGVLRIAQGLLLQEIRGVVDHIRDELVEVHQEIPKAAAIERLNPVAPHGYGDATHQAAPVWWRLLNDWPAELAAPRSGSTDEH